MTVYTVLGTTCMAVVALFIVCHYADPHRVKADRRARR